MRKAHLFLRKLVVFMKKLFTLYCFRLSGLTRSEKTDIANEIKLSLLYLNLPSKWKQKSSHDVCMYVSMCVSGLKVRVDEFTCLLSMLWLGCSTIQ